MSEFTERCRNAIIELMEMSKKEAIPSRGATRLLGKVEGVKLALSYYNETEAGELAALVAENADLKTAVTALQHENIKLLRNVSAKDARIAELEDDLRSAPNPYAEDFELSRYKGWYVTDRTHNVRAAALAGNENAA